VSAVADQDLLSPELTEDPFAYYAELRASDPVHWAPASKAWLLTCYDDVVAAFGDPRLSSDRVRPLLDVLPAQRRAEYGPMMAIISRWISDE
jgi:cytochrome P450